MSDPLNVDPAALVTSGAEVDWHSQSLFAAHSGADDVIESAVFGWVGQSQAALTAKAAQWTTATRAFAARLYGHGEGLRLSGFSFAEQDSSAARSVTEVYRPDGSTGNGAGSRR